MSTETLKAKLATVTVRVHRMQTMPLMQAATETRNLATELLDLLGLMVEKIDNGNTRPD